MAAIISVTSTTAQLAMFYPLLCQSYAEVISDQLPHSLELKIFLMKLYMFIYVGLGLFGDLLDHVGQEVRTLSFDAFSCLPTKIVRHTNYY